MYTTIFAYGSAVPPLFSRRFLSLVRLGWAQQPNDLGDSGVEKLAIGRIAGTP
jgi:hypothetical protein